MIEGFPDYYLDHVLLAMSNLNYRSYIFFSTYDSVVHISLNADKRREVLEIVDPFSDPQHIVKNEQVDPVAFRHQSADNNVKNKRGKRFFISLFEKELTSFHASRLFQTSKYPRINCSVALLSCNLC